MTTRSNRLTRLGFTNRTELHLPTSYMKRFKKHIIDKDHRTQSEALSYLIREALRNNFEELFVADKPELQAELVFISTKEHELIESKAQSIIEKNALTEEQQAPLKELMSMFFPMNYKAAKGKQGETAFLDCWVDDTAQAFFERMKERSGTKASKSQVVTAAIDFMEI